MQGGIGRASPRRKHPTATVVVGLCGLVPVLAIAGVTADGRLLDPLVPVLVAGAAASNVMDVRLEGRLWVSGSFLCCLMAAAVLGPSAGALVALGSEIAAWAWRRIPFVPLVINCVGAVVPTWMAGVLLAAARPLVGSEGLEFDLILGAVAGLALVMNIVLVSALMGMTEGLPFIPRSAAYRRLAPLVVANVVLLVPITAAYDRVGVAAAIFLIAGMLVFTYVVRMLVDARQRANRISELAADRRQLVADALDADERARRVLAEELHDDALQTLLAAKQDLEDARHGDEAGVRRADAAIRATVAKLRSAVFELHPAILEHAGLESALIAVAEEHGRRAGFAAHIAVEPGLSGVDDHLVFALCRELIANAAKHAGAGNVWVRLTRAGPDVALEVRDDGRGFDPGRRAQALRDGHIGLASSAERVGAVGGELGVESEPHAGTIVRVRLPATGLPGACAHSRRAATPAGPGA